MQQVQRSMMSAHIQTPTLQQRHPPYDDLPSNAPAPRHMMFSQSSAAASASAMYEEQNRILQQQNEAKIAPQRALGLAPNGPSVQHQPGLVMPGQIRQVMMPNGQAVFIDAHNRQVQPPPGYTLHAVPQRPSGPPQNGLIQVQAGQQYQQQHPPYTSQMSQAQYAHAQQIAIQQQHIAAARQHQQAQTQPSSARPVHAGSPATLGVRGPLRRANSQAGSMRSASPIPPHIRNAMSEGVAQMIPQRPGEVERGQSPANGFSLGPATITPPHASDTVLPVAAAPDAAVPVVAAAPPATEAKKTENRKPKAFPTSPTSKARKGGLKVDRMKKLVDSAQKQYDAALREAERARLDLERRLCHCLGDPDRKRFDDLVEEYLEKAGYVEAYKSLKSDRDVKPVPTEDPKPGLVSNEDTGATSSGNTSVVGEDMEVAIADKPLKVTPTSTAASPADPSSPSKATASPSIDPHSELRHDEDAGSLFGDCHKEGNQSAVLGSVGVEESSETLKDVEMPAQEQEVKEEVSKDQPEELGYLFMWWRAFDETQQLISLGIDPDELLRTFPSVGCPTPAMGSAPPALDAIPPSDEPVAPHNVTAAHPPQANLVPDGDSSVFLHPPAPAPSSANSAVTSTLQQAEMMRKMQQAQIRAQQQGSTGTPIVGEDAVRRIQWQAVAPARGDAEERVAQKTPVRLPDGTIVLMTREEVERYSRETQQVLHHNLIQESERRGIASNGQVVLQHPQPLPANGPIHPDMGARMVHPIQNVYNGMVDEIPGNGVKRQGDPSPVDGPSKRAKVGGKRPTPEDHQRLALDAANRAQGLPVGGPRTPQDFTPQPGRTNVQQQGRPITEAQRLYAQRQAEYARLHVVGMPESSMLPSPLQPANEQMGIVQYLDPASAGSNGVPSTATIGPSPPSAKGKSKKAPTLSLDVNGSVNEDAPPTTGSAKRKGGAAKRGAKAPGSARGGKRTAKARASIDASTDGEAGPFAFPGQTPRNPVEDSAVPPSSSAPGSSQSTSFALPGPSYPQDPTDGQTPPGGHNHQAANAQWPAQQFAPHQNNVSSQYDSGGTLPTNHATGSSDGSEEIIVNATLGQFDPTFANGAVTMDDDFFKSLAAFADNDTSFAQTSGDGAASDRAPDGPPMSASGSMGFDLDSGTFGEFDFGNFNSSNDHDAWV